MPEKIRFTNVSIRDVLRRLNITPTRTANMKINSAQFYIEIPKSKLTDETNRIVATLELSGFNVETSNQPATHDTYSVFFSVRREVES